MAPKAGSKTAKDKSAARSAGSACRTLINPFGVYVPGYSRIISTRCYWSCFCVCCYWLAPSTPERRLSSKQHRSSYFHATSKVHVLTCMICGQTVKSGFQALLKAPLAGASNLGGSCSGHSQCPHRCGRPWGLERTVAKLWKR